MDPADAARTSATGPRPPWFRHTGLILARASTVPPGLELPNTLHLGLDADLGADADETRGAVREWKAWLGRLWKRPEVRAALRVASPVLASKVDAIVAHDDASDQSSDQNDDRFDDRQMRRVVVSVSSYLRRWQRRATPFGLFAGIAPVTVGAAATRSASVRFGDAHRTVARPDATWMDGVITALERHPDLLPQLRVVANDAGYHRGDRFVVPTRPDERTPQAPAALEASVRCTRPVSAALELAHRPVLVADLIRPLQHRFAQAGAAAIGHLLAELIEIGVLISSLRAPMTSADPLDHLIRELDALDLADLPELAGHRRQLATIGEQLRSLTSRKPTDETTDDTGHADNTVTALDAVTAKMRAAHRVPGRVIAVDVALDAEITLPRSVVHEAENAATTLLRLTPYPFGDPIWRDYHARFLDRYGVGVVVGVRDLVADSGLGYPTGFLAAARPRPAYLLTERDTTLLTLIQQAALDGRSEIALTEQTIRDLRVGDHDKLVPPRRVELICQVHASSLDAVTRGRFQLWIVGAPMHTNSAAARFAHLLTEHDRHQFVASYLNDPAGKDTARDSLPTQLSFAPRRLGNENITRAPQLLPYVMHLGEHAAYDRDVSPATGSQAETRIGIDDVGVTADARHLLLVRLSTGQEIQPHIPHALEATTQTPPLARFLAEAASARCGAFGPPGFGAAHDLPFLPRLRHGRIVLAAARWLLTTSDLPPSAEHSLTTWDHALDDWRDRWHVPTTVLLCESDRRLPLDLTDHRDRALLRARLHRNRSGRIELRETGASDSHGWAGRPCELVIPLTATHQDATLRASTPRASTPLRVVARSDAALPGRSPVLRAHVHGHPQRFDDALHDLHAFLADLQSPLRRWWFWRHHDRSRPDGDQHLALCLRLHTAADYPIVAAQLADWAARLRAVDLLADLTLATHHAAAIADPIDEALEEIRARDSAAALAQLTSAHRTGLANQAIAAVSLTDLAAALVATPDEGLQLLVDTLPREHGRLDVQLSATSLAMVTAAGRPHPPTDAIARAWDHRRTALAAYRDQLLSPSRSASTSTGLSADIRPALPALLHEHHLRAVSVDPGVEKVTFRLARAVAQRRLALGRRNAP
ncbi:lantibiotic dehydratase [Labedaea rhizosphaerae]|uniref:Thiopeptide-type bacteriocin biosynthesis protein n=1 Tax=Labedaea rhizosphaerae TaxID=598644 RepID=A0A4R6SGL0_LABRH|nr:lantibiotic dehydratase [Labedaea rhizosphaerae]TDQ00650.1 thiopeptide-type bacteriocin biosynthesis protein [Labedaea rhizosphaerae]